MRAFLIVFTLLLPHAADAAETLPFDFAREYVREIVTNENMRARAEKDMGEPNADKMAASIRSGTRIILELRSQVSVLQGMTLNAPGFERLPRVLAKLYEDKIDVNDRVIELSTAFEKSAVSGPEPSIDYGALVAEFPKLTARNEYIDRMLFENVTKLVFIMLIDDSKPDKSGNTGRLIIRRAQRDQLIASLQAGFGKKMNKKGDQGYFVASGTVLRDVLLNRKCADDPGGD